jgi:hypothetical protein
MRSRPSSPCREPHRSEPRRRRFSPEALERLRAAALADRPWEKTRGPITPQGKARSARNGRFKQRNEQSRRELRAEVAEVLALVRAMTATRRLLS